MVSPLRFVNTPSIEEYTEEDMAKFAAYMDIQTVVEHEDFALPLEQEILDYLDDNGSLR